MKTTTQILWMLVLANVAIVLLGVSVILAGDKQRNLTKATVYAVCNQSRQQINGAAERACGDIQDQTHTEFLCASRDMNANTHCWVEVK